MKIKYGAATIDVAFFPREDATQWRKKQTLPLHFGHTTTEVGELVAIWDDETLKGLGILDFGRAQWGLDDLANRWKNAAQHQDITRTQRLADALFGDTPLKLKAEVTATAFQVDVIKALIETPFNQTQSYGDIAHKIGRPKAVRAVGGAVGSQPLGVIVPCHRIIGSDGSMTGFYWGLEVKKRLLDYEGSF